jgi:NADH:ubiquinone oxidoreductase subunit
MNIGTRLFTLLYGKQVGTDAAGNRYFIDRRPSRGRLRVRRWVVYHGVADPSSIPAEWHPWLHYTTDEPVPALPRYAWQSRTSPILPVPPPPIAHRAMTMREDIVHLRMAIMRAGCQTTLRARPKPRWCDRAGS